MLLVLSNNLDYKNNFLSNNKILNLENYNNNYIIFNNNESLIYGEIDNKNSNNNLFKINEKRKYYLKKELSKFFKSLNISLNITNDFLEKIIKYNKSLPLETSYLIIKPFKNNFIRFIYLNPSKKIYNENNLGYEEWNSWEKEFITLKNEIDFHIKSKNKNQVEKLFKIIHENIKKFINKINLPINQDNRNFYKLNIIYISNNFYIPFEYLNENTFVHYSILSKRINKSTNSKEIKIFYSEELEYSKKEAYSIIKLLENNYKIELLTVEKIFNYLPETNTTGTLHIISHGNIIDNKGYISFNNNLIDKLSLTSNNELIFLNCCFLGLTFEGIIENALRNNCKYVIASPFEITDEDKISQFYLFYNPEYVELSYHIYSLYNSEFQKYFRIYENYYDK